MKGIDKPLDVGFAPSWSDRLLRITSAGRALRDAALAVALAFAVTACFIVLSGHNPVLAFAHMARGAVGSEDALSFALNKSAPYILAATGIALCFRARIINIGAEGQIAVGGICATWTALHFGTLPGVLPIVAALFGAAIGGGVWACIAALLRIGRGVNEVISTLMLNFVGLLMVGEVLNGPMGEAGAGFPQSPLVPDGALLPMLLSGADLHIGILIALAASGLAALVLWRTPFGFGLRVLGASASAARYAGVSSTRLLLAVMALAGALAGIAGGVEVLGVQSRLIEGFSVGFGFKAVAVALLGGLDPLAVIPAGLFFGFVEAGALAMQREIGVPSSLVDVIQGLTMAFVLCARGLDRRQRRV
ncbi:ABC transporter permease [Pararobbsia silviterrae]|uniref:ABC transporter permease n=1 Tax=Pararobbsia silviterrae TaxID=1792498 RepID=A0A494X5Q9_9BURK|nr:ABC transporter permease [Pararobbsia silviterrae]RKP44991.1 ABC transporter permease [Pararobbsia silviterrae]